MYELLIVLVSFAAGWIVREMYAEYRINSILDQLESESELEEEEETLTVEPESNVYHVILEHHNNEYFVYSRENYRFLAQGKTLDELKINLAKSLPGKQFGVTPENLRELGITNI